MTCLLFMYSISMWATLTSKTGDDEVFPSKQIIALRHALFDQPTNRHGHCLSATYLLALSLGVVVYLCPMYYRYNYEEDIKTQPHITDHLENCFRSDDELVNKLRAAK